MLFHDLQRALGVHSGPGLFEAGLDCIDCVEERRILRLAVGGVSRVVIVVGVDRLALTEDARSEEPFEGPDERITRDAVVVNGFPVLPVEVCVRGGNGRRGHVGQIGRARRLARNAVEVFGRSVRS